MTTTLPDSIQWSEGMLLSPQHLQQHDMYLQAHLNYKIACMTPHMHGVLKLAIDREALAKGIVSVTALDCLLDDGHAVSYPGNYQQLKLECNVAELCKKDGRPVRVWVALPRRGIDAAGMATSDRRYDLLPGEMTGDENLDNGYEVSVVRMQARIRLLAGQTVPPQFSACALLEVMMDAQNRFRLTAFHPPMLRLGASTFQDAPGMQESLQAKLIDQTAKLWSKLGELASNRNDDMPDDYSMLGSEVQRQLMVARALAACLPQLDIAVSSGIARPEEVYRVLAQVVGQVACVGADPVPLKMEPYAHDDCMPQFQRVFDYIEAKLRLVNTAYDFMEFAHFGEGGFARRLPVDADDEVLVELKPREGQSLGELARWLGDARIANVELMTDLQRRRLNGALARPLSTQEILQRNLHPHAALFSIRNDSIDIEGKGRVAMFGPDQSLLIQGATGSRMPAAIILYKRKAVHAVPTPVPQAPAAKDEETDADDV
jgi:type VI secretion system protein ImpJ